MGLVEKQTLINKLSPPIEHLLAVQLVDEFVSAERRFIQRDWEPAELDGGQFAEVLARIIYHLDSGTLNHTKKFDDCVKYIERDDLPHAITPRHNALHTIRVLKTIYNFRSQRGAVHITPSYKANHMDSKLVIEAVRWCMNETLRLYWTDNREAVGKVIRELLQFDVPCIGVFDDVIMVQRTDLNVDEEVLVLLHYAGEDGFSRKEIGEHCMYAPQRITEAISRLKARDCRQIVETGTGKYKLTGLGSRRLREQLADKLLLQ